MRLVRYADRRPMRWKNGGGETREIAVHPPDAGLDAFDWRVSMARVAADGPFSAFPGVDRMLAILDGDGFDLAVEGAAPVRLTRASDPHAFPADAPAAARLLGAPVLDLNVMTRRGRFAAAVTALDLSEPARVGAEGDTLLLLCTGGEVAADDMTLRPYDALVLSGAEAVTVRPTAAPADIRLVAIRPSGAERPAWT